MGLFPTTKIGYYFCEKAHVWEVVKNSEQNKKCQKMDGSWRMGQVIKSFMTKWDKAFKSGLSKLQPLRLDSKCGVFLKYYFYCTIIFEYNTLKCEVFLKYYFYCTIIF